MRVSLLGALLAGVSVLSAGSVTAQNLPHARLFPPEDLGQLERPDRALWQKPDQIMDSLSIADGSRVADLGAGGGWFTVRLARRVGPNGVVYAQDVQPEMLDAIDYRVNREGLTNVETVLGTTESPLLPAALAAIGRAPLACPAAIGRRSRSRLSRRGTAEGGCGGAAGRADSHTT